MGLWILSVRSVADRRAAADIGGSSLVGAFDAAPRIGLNWFEWFARLAGVRVSGSSESPRETLAASRYPARRRAWRALRKLDEAPPARVQCACKPDCKSAPDPRARPCRVVPSAGRRMLVTPGSRAARAGAQPGESKQRLQAAQEM